MTKRTMTFQALIDQVATDTDLNREQAAAALTGAMGLFRAHADRAVLTRFYDAVIGSEDAARSPEAKAKSGGGLFGGLLSNAGGLSGKVMADAMGLVGRLSKMGVKRSSLRDLFKSARRKIRQETGEDLLTEVLRTVPGVSALMGDGRE